MDINEVGALLHTEDLVRGQPLLAGIKSAIWARLLEINAEIGQENQAKIEAKKKADAEAAHLAAVEQAEMPHGKLDLETQKVRFQSYQEPVDEAHTIPETPIYPAGTGPQETTRRV